MPYPIYSVPVVFIKMPAFYNSGIFLYIYPMKLTINEIADMAHVAKSTVSKAINGQKGVSEENRRRILKIIQEVNFQPNASARALAQNKSGSIGLILPHRSVFTLSGQYWAGIISSIADEANRRGNSLSVISTQGETDLPVSTLERILRQHSIDGLIIGAEQINTKEIISVLQEELPFVFLGRNRLLEHYSVDVDNVQGAYKLTKSLIAQNKKNIGCITGPIEYDYTRQRLNGFVQAMGEENLDAGKTVNCQYEAKEIYKKTCNLIEENPQIDALFLTAGEEFVLEVLDAVKTVKGDTKNFIFAAFDDSHIYDYLNCKIISARQPLENLGKTAAGMLFDLISGKEIPRPNQCLNVEIINHN